MATTQNKTPQSQETQITMPMIVIGAALLIILVGAIVYGIVRVAHSGSLDQSTIAAREAAKQKNPNLR